jgi:hypothetical protein
MEKLSGGLAALLAHEFAVWFRNLGLQGILPRAFTGVTRDGVQGIIVLTGLPFDHVQRRDFLIWLCRVEQFVAYAYGTHVGRADNDFNVTERIDIYASSDSHDVLKALDINTCTGGTFEILDRDPAIVMSAGPENGIFLGLQRSTNHISSDDQSQFLQLWGEMRAKAIWWQR